MVGDMSDLNHWNAGLYDRSFSYIQDMAVELIELLEPRNGEKILDLGCGTGAMTNNIVQRGALVDGIDNDSAMINLARKRYPKIKFLCISGTDFSSNSQYDAVFSNAALHWMKQPAIVIDRMSNVLRPGGRFVGEMGGSGNVQILIKCLLQTLEEMGLSRDKINCPWYFPHPDEYAKLLEEGGFRVKYIQHFSRLTPLDDCPNGAADWYNMFAGKFLENIELENRDVVIKRATRLAKNSLFKDGRWFADYKRLRFKALRREF
tara:strand:- start:1252 stop:2037 length:786 start_codon:yes stop_codon:yes gene_type:complete